LGLIVAPGPRCLGLAAMPSSRALGLATMLVIDDVSHAEVDDASPILPRFHPFWWLKNQSLCSFAQNAYKNTLKTMKNSYMALKTPPKKPKKPNST